jgi:NAD(P)-dependent dehydrogenase (short-subunit alcohol dehydrogenase family)
MAPSDVEFSSIAEVREKSAKDPTMAYGLSKLGNILLGRQLVARRLGGGTNVLVTSVHPGTVDTDVQETWTESYGFLGTMTNGLMRLLGKSAPEGAEACLWAATATDINAVNAAEYQVRGACARPCEAS